MAFEPTQFSRIAHAAGHTVHLYHSPDTFSVIDASGYFDAVAEQLRQWDVIIACSLSPMGAQLLLVTSPTATTPVITK